MDTQTIRNEMIAAAKLAARVFFDEVMKGEDRGCCGFAWVKVYPENKGNTREGKQERKTLEALGFRKDWTGKAWELWNPASFPCQNIDTLEAGARAAASVLKNHGFKAFAQSRLD
jgi:hypothetical protein